MEVFLVVVGVVGCCDIMVLVVFIVRIRIDVVVLCIFIFICCIFGSDWMLMLV